MIKPEPFLFRSVRARLARRLRRFGIQRSVAIRTDLGIKFDSAIATRTQSFCLKRNHLTLEPHRKRIGCCAPDEMSIESVLSSAILRLPQPSRPTLVGGAAQKETATMLKHKRLA